MTRFIAIASAKGGVGKTSTALNLGTAMTNFGKDVVVLDANLSTPRLGLHLGAPRLPATLNDALEGTTHITNTAYVHPSGLKIIPASISLDRIKNVRLKSLQNVLLDLAGATEIVLVDVAAGLGAESIAALKGCDQMIIVTAPDLPAITDAIKAVQMGEELGCETIGVIINRSRGEEFEIEAKNIGALIDRPIIGIVPEDSTVRKSLALKHPVVYTHPDSPAAVAFKKIAAQLLGQTYIHSITKELKK